MALVQTPKRVLGTGGEMAASPFTISFTNTLTPGSTIVVGLIRSNPSASKTFTVTDTADGTLLDLIVSREFGSGLFDEQVLIFARRNVPGGNTNLSVTVSTVTGSGTLTYEMFEVSGIDPTGTIQTGSIEDSASNNSKVDSSVALTGTGFVYTLSSISGARISTPGAGYTLGVPGVGVSKEQCSQYLIGTVTANQGPHTHDGLATTRMVGAMMILPEQAVGGIGYFQRRTLVGGMQIPRGGIG